MSAYAAPEARCTSVGTFVTGMISDGDGVSARCSAAVARLRAIRLLRLALMGR